MTLRLSTEQGPSKVTAMTCPGVKPRKNVSTKMWTWKCHISVAHEKRVLREPELWCS